VVAAVAGLIVLGSAVPAHAAPHDGGPSAIISDDCGDDGVRVVLDNPTRRDVEFVVLWVSADGTALQARKVTVAARDAQTVFVSVPERVEINVSVWTGDDQLAKLTVNRDCSDPSATIATSCADGGAVVTLANAGRGPVLLVVAKNNEPVGDPVRVPAAGSVRVIVPLVDGEHAYISVSTLAGEFVADAAVEQSCPAPAVTGLTTSCAAHGVAAALANTGTADATFQVTKDATLVSDGVVVTGGGTAQVVVPFLEDETATVAVSSGGTVLASDSFTLDCAQVGGIQITPTTNAATSSTVLPVTGAPTRGLTIIAGVMLVVGGILVLIGRARAPR
jgi:hypothetical protein